MPIYVLWFLLQNNNQGTGYAFRFDNERKYRIGHKQLKRFWREREFKFYLPTQCGGLGNRQMLICQAIQKQSRMVRLPLNKIGENK